MARLWLQLLCVLGLHLGPVLSLEVEYLTTSNFDKIVNGNTNVLVMFYTQDCGHCRVMDPEYEAAAAALTFEDNILLAKVDSEEDEEIAERFDIDGHPIFKWFPMGQTDAENFFYVHYTGRMGNTLLKMIGDRIDGFKRVLPPIQDYITKLTDTSFDEFCFDRSKNVLVYMYSPWADRTDIKQAMDKTGAAFDGEPSVALAKLAIERVHERDIADRFGVKEYPGFVFFDTAGEWEIWDDDGNDAQSMMNFLNKKAGTFVSADGTLVPGAARVKAMEKFVGGPMTPEAIAEATAVVDTLGGAQADNARQYVKVMERIAQKGPSYVDSELKRLDTLLGKPSITAEKRKLFHTRKDILSSFSAAASNTKDEL